MWREFNPWYIKRVFQKRGRESNSKGQADVPAVERMIARHKIELCMFIFGIISSGAVQMRSESLRLAAGLMRRGGSSPVVGGGLSG